MKEAGLPPAVPPRKPPAWRLGGKSGFPRSLAWRPREGRGLPRRGERRPEAAKVLEGSDATQYERCGTCGDGGETRRGESGAQKQPGVLEGERRHAIQKDLRRL